MSNSMMKEACVLVCSSTAGDAAGQLVGVRVCMLCTLNDADVLAVSMHFYAQLEKQQASLLAAERGVRAAAEADASLICKDYERRLAELEAQLEQRQVCVFVFVGRHLGWGGDVWVMGFLGRCGGKGVKGSAGSHPSRLRSDQSSAK
eukprot:1154203-Pelagomonas_calceolata.AAC.10